MLWIVFAHFMGDYALQSSWIARNKAKFWYIMLAHGAIWTACICAGLQYLGILTWYKIPFLLIGHMAMDTLKHENAKKGDAAWTYIDQSWHLLQCLVVGFL